MYQLIAFEERENVIFIRNFRIRSTWPAQSVHDHRARYTARNKILLVSDDHIRLKVAAKDIHFDANDIFVSYILIGA